jgi:hypothetical protein
MGAVPNVLTNVGSSIASDMLAKPAMSATPPDRVAAATNAVTNMGTSTLGYYAGDIAGEQAGPLAGAIATEIANWISSVGQKRILPASNSTKEK